MLNIETWGEGGSGGEQEPTSLSLPPPCTSATPPKQSKFLKILDLHPF